MKGARINRVYSAVNIGSFRVSAMILGVTEMGEKIVLGTGHRASAGIKRGYVTDIRAAEHAVRDAIERAEREAQVDMQSAWIGCAGAGLTSHVSQVETDIGGRRIEADDVEHLLVSARKCIQPDGRMILHAQPASYTLDGAHGVADPTGLHAERLAVNIHVMLADSAPLRNLTEVVQNVHLQVKSVVGAPVAAAYACLSDEERELGTALVEIGAEVTTVAVYKGGMLTGLESLAFGSADITDALAGVFGIRCSQAERLKCVAGSAIASVADHREMISVDAPGEEQSNQLARGADDKNRIPRAAIVSVVTEELGNLTNAIAASLKKMEFPANKGGQVVLTGGGAELAGIAEFTQAALGRPVRVGKGPTLRGLPEAHSTPGFSTLAGLCLYAVEDPVDIRSISSPYQTAIRAGGYSTINRFVGAMKKYF